MSTSSAQAPRTSSSPFADLELSRRLERAEAEASVGYVEASALAFPQRGACWRRLGGAFALYDGPSAPTTQTFGLGLFEPATAAVLEEVEAFFRDRGAPVHHEVSPLAGVALYAQLQERGYRPVELTSVLVRPIAELAAMPAQPAGGTTSDLRVRIAGAADADLSSDADVVADTMVRGWRSEEPEVVGFLDDFRLLQRHRRDGLAFLVDDLAGGGAVAVGMLAIHGGVALLAGACTVPEARRRGAQNALLAARLRYAAEHGCDLAAMGAAPGSGSQRNAERNGFRVAYTRLKWRLG
jgi:hypothetical protein